MSNFYLAPFELDGKRWPSVEHYFQAQKAINDPVLFAQIHKASHPIVAKRLGRKAKLPEDWEHKRIEVMRKAVKTKFLQNPKLAEKLLQTGEALLVEDAFWDEFWGSGPNGKGKNMLGKILMEIREELKGL